MSRATLRELLDSIPALLFPDRCGACEALCDGPFCAPCSETLLPVPAGGPLCGEPGDEALLPALRACGSVSSTTCSPPAPPRRRRGGRCCSLGRFAWRCARLRAPRSRRTPGRPSSGHAGAALRNAAGRRAVAALTPSQEPDAEP